MFVFRDRKEAGQDGTSRRSSSKLNWVDRELMRAYRSFMPVPVEMKIKKKECPDDVAVEQTK